VLHAARAALRDAPPRRRLGAVRKPGVPIEGLALAEHTWLEAICRGSRASGPIRATGSPLEPATLLRQALELEGPCIALDAACASSLYAIKHACDWLHDGLVDAALAGAVNKCDDLFIHVGFAALAALSKSGVPSPFDKQADGLVPAEGAAFLTLKRLADAERDGDTIHGVIRGIGLSNDGRSGGLLAPAQEGQARALRQAYAMSGIDPASISLVECHATGTVVGDGAGAQQPTCSARGRRFPSSRTWAPSRPPERPGSSRC
jgi:acyl transferase domain-containing protein